VARLRKHIEFAPDQSSHEVPLNCRYYGAAINEARQLNFMGSRRRQLATEQNHVTGTMLRKEGKRSGLTCALPAGQLDTIA